MKIVKRINNNTVICTNDAGREFVALGRGIGYPDGSDDIPLSSIERTFYDMDEKYLPLLDEIDPEVIEFSAQIADIARANISRELSTNLPFTLADHIAFAIKRAKEHMYVQMPLAYDVQQNYPTEYKIAQFTLKGIEREFGVRLPRSEASGIALCIVNSVLAPASKAKSNDERRIERTLERLTKLVEQLMDVSVDRDGFEFARYATHVRYLLNRVAAGESLETENGGLYEPLCEQYPEVARCVDGMARLIEREYGGTITDEEKVYLMLHVNRLCAEQLSQKKEGMAERDA